MKPRGGEGQNGRLKCPMGFLVYFYDDNPLFSALKNTSVFCFHGAKCSQAKEKTAYESMQ